MYYKKDLECLIESQLLMQCLKFEFACVAVAPGGLDGIFGFIGKAAVLGAVGDVGSETESKGEAEGKEVGKGRSKSQRAHSKEWHQANCPLQECKVWFDCGGKWCFLLDALESRVHFEHLSECLSAFGTEFVAVASDSASKEEAEGKEVGKEEATVSVRIPKSGSSKVVRFRNARCGLFVEEGCFLPDDLESRVHFERLYDCLSAFGTESSALETARKEEAEVKEVGKGRSTSQRAHSKRAGQGKVVR